METWFEIFIDKGGEHGTETIETADTIQEAENKLIKLKKTTEFPVYIDKWEMNDGSPCRIDMTEEEGSIIEIAKLGGLR